MVEKIYPANTRLFRLGKKESNGSGETFHERIEDEF